MLLIIMMLVKTTMIIFMKLMELTVKFMMELMESRTKSLWAELMMEVRLVGGQQFHQKLPGDFSHIQMSSSAKLKPHHSTS